MYLFAARGDIWVWLCSAFDRGTTCPDCQCLTIVFLLWSTVNIGERRGLEALQILFAKINQLDVARFGKVGSETWLVSWAQDDSQSHRICTVALLIKVWGGRGSLVGGVEEILGAQTKQIRRRYWREGGSIFQPTPQLPHEKVIYDCLTCPTSICKSQGSAECS